MNGATYPLVKCSFSYHYFNQSTQLYSTKQTSSIIMSKKVNKNILNRNNTPWHCIYYSECNNDIHLIDIPSLFRNRIDFLVAWSFFKK